ncbi:MAG: nucleotide exchange factor GrpE [Nitrospirae bacterium]|nr:nucleotide exchange factor GrpE [Nitrospirota bacterium]
MKKSEESDEDTVVSEFRKGYMLKDKVLRASLVGVSKKPIQETEIKEEA